MTHPPSGGPISADVGEGLVIIPVRSAEGNLLDGLVHNEVLTQEIRQKKRGSRNQRGCSIVKNSQQTLFFLV